MRRSLVLATLSILSGCGFLTAHAKGKPKAPEACVAERIDGGVKITCPDSEAIVYDGEVGESCSVSADGVITCKDSSYSIPAGPAGAPGTGCTVTGDGLITCGVHQYQLPYTVPEQGCTYVILGGTNAQ